MEKVYVNNFRFYKSQENEPPYLTEVDSWGELVVYSSTFNELIFVVFDPNPNIYYVYENNGKSKHPLKDLKKAHQAFNPTQPPEK